MGGYSAAVIALLGLLLMASFIAGWALLLFLVAAFAFRKLDCQNFRDSGRLVAWLGLFCSLMWF